MKIYKVKYRATFEGVIEVRADSKVRAKFIVDQGFGGLGAEVGHSSWLADASEEDDEGIVDWDIDTSPTETKII